MNGTLAMAAGFGRGATHDLTRVGLTLARRPRRARWIALVALLVVGAFAGGAALGELLREQILAAAATPATVRTPAPAPTGEMQQLRQQLEQATMELRVAQARGHELERQIDALNQKLTETEEQLTFVRKAREGRKH